MKSNYSLGDVVPSYFLFSFESFLQFVCLVRLGKSLQSKWGAQVHLHQKANNYAVTLGQMLDTVLVCANTPIKNETASSKTLLRSAKKVIT